MITLENANRGRAGSRPMVRRSVLLFCTHLLVASVTMVGTAFAIRQGLSREIAKGIRNNCLVMASVTRAQFQKAGIPSKTLAVDYDIKGVSVRHVAVISALEDGSLAAFDQIQGSHPLGFVPWDAWQVAGRLPAQSGARILRAGWVDSLSFENLRWQEKPEGGALLGKHGMPHAPSPRL